MKPDRKFLFFLCFGLWVACSLAQEGPSAGSGIGMLSPGAEIRTMHINFPLAEIEIFETPGGKSAGVIFKKNSLNLVYRRTAANTLFRVDDRDLVEIEPMGYCLKYFASEKGCVLILVNSTGKGYWVSLKELSYLKFQPKTWLEVMVEKHCLYSNMVEMGINLRKTPGTGNNKIILVKGSLYGISLTGNTEGLWAEAKVFRFGSPPCWETGSNPPAAEEWDGWIKVIDDAGYPNIWFAGEDCK